VSGVATALVLERDVVGRERGAQAVEEALFTGHG
jgi:hypothetical protein